MPPWGLVEVGNWLFYCIFWLITWPRVKLPLIHLDPLCPMKIPWPSWGVIEVHQQLLASQRSWHRSITSWKTSENQSLFPEVLKPHIHWYANSWISLVTSCNLQICNTMVDFVSKLTSEPTKYEGYLAPMEAHDLLPKSSVGIGGCRFWRLFREVHNMLLVTMSSL